MDIEQGSPAAPESAPEIVEQVPASAEGAAPEGETPPEQPEKPRQGAKERIDQLTARYREQERVAREHQQAREAAEAKLANYERQQARAQHFSQIDAQAPQIDQFNSLQEFQMAMSNWTTQRAAAIAEAQWEERTQAQAEAQAKHAYALHQQQQRVMQENAVLGTKLAPGEKKYADFREVVSNPEVPSIRGTPLLQIITAADNTADISYLLAKNPAEIHRLLQLPPALQAREVYKLDQKFTGNGASSAPPPPPNRNGSAAPTVKDYGDMGMAEYIKARQQGRNRNR